MDPTYRDALLNKLDSVLRSTAAPSAFRARFPWLTGALGDPNSGIWFVAENPSLTQLERVNDPLGGPPTEEAQWWASRGDQLFRRMLVKHGFKDAPESAHGGWHCYITNAIKQPDYAGEWRGTRQQKQDAAADAWARVLRWELEHSKPRLVVAMGGVVERILRRMQAAGVRFPQTMKIQHYSYVALRPRGKLGPMHPQRVAEYDAEFATVASRFHGLHAVPSSNEAAPKTRSTPP